MNTQPTSRIRRGSSRALRAAALLALAGCHSTVPIESQCAVTSDCDEGLACVGGLCRAPCNVDRDCPASGRCVTGTAASGRVCVNETFRPVCARSSECASPLVCGPGGLCVAQCAVDADCASLHATARCGAGGECALPDETCADAGARCGDACVDLSRDPLHCGACGRACTAPIGGSATCVGGVCGASCEPGMHRCGAACVRDGDVATCGTSCVPCVAPAGATPTCASGACGFVCPTGTAACAGRCLDVTRDDANCGACDRACGDGRSCRGGMCVFASTGNEGSFTPSTSVALTPGVHHFTTIRVPQGVRVTSANGGALELRATGDVLIEGEVDVSGGEGGVSATGGGAGGVAGQPLTSTVTWTMEGITCFGQAPGGGIGEAGTDGTGAFCPASGGRFGGGAGGSYSVVTGSSSGGGGGGVAGGGGGLGNANTNGGDGGSAAGTQGGLGARWSPFANAGGGVAAAPYGGGAGGGRATCGLSGRATGGGGGSIGALAAADLAVATTFAAGSSGGGGGGNGNTPCLSSGGGGGGGGGGGALRVTSATRITLGAHGALRANGGRGGQDVWSVGGCGGGGSGGVVFVAAPAIAIPATAVISAVGGAGGPCETQCQGAGGAGGLGRIRLSVNESSCVIDGTLTPPLDTSRCAPTTTSVAGRVYVTAYPE